MQRSQDELQEQRRTTELAIEKNAQLKSQLKDSLARLEEFESESETLKVLQRRLLDEID